MKWVHIKGNMYKCPACGTRFTIGKEWKCCPVCEQELSGVREQSISDYIKREDAIRAVKKSVHRDVAIDSVNRIPSANVAEVKHSVWRVVSAGPDEEYECMNCKEAVGWKYLYCPNCGARMDGESNE